MGSNFPTKPSAYESADAYAVFSGEITQDSTRRIFESISGASLKNFAHVHFLFESYGGFVGDGIALYNFFKTLPIGLTVYNCGTVQSIAAIAYLGARTRKASARASFMIHSTRAGTALATAKTLHAVSKGITLDDERTRSILKEHLTLTAEEWAALDHYDLHFSAEESVKIGLAQEIAEFTPPFGSKIYNV